jgi:membrane-associated phospholipid phosphatase
MLTVFLQVLPGGRGRCLFAPLCGLGLLLVAPLCAQGQVEPPRPPSAAAPPPGWVPSLRTMGGDALDIVRAPLDLTSAQKLKTLGATGLVLSTMAALDRPAHRRLHLGDGPSAAATGPLAAPGRWYDRVGPDRALLGTAGVIAASGVVLQRRPWTRTSVRLVEAVLYTKVVTGLAKSAINRSRPFSAADPFTATPGAFSGTHDKLSMPSGHTARAFAAASVLAHQSGRWYVSVPAYGMAASVGLERVRSGDHWLTDVMVGGTLGYLIGRAVSSPRSGNAVTYTPILSTDRVGLSVRF